MAQTRDSSRAAATRAGMTGERDGRGQRRHRHRAPCDQCPASYLWVMISPLVRGSITDLTPYAIGCSLRMAERSTNGYAPAGGSAFGLLARSLRLFRLCFAGLTGGVLSKRVSASSKVKGCSESGLSSCLAITLFYRLRAGFHC